MNKMKPYIFKDSVKEMCKEGIQDEVLKVGEKFGVDTSTMNMKHRCFLRAYLLALNEEMRDCIELLSTGITKREKIKKQVKR